MRTFSIEAGKNSPYVYLDESRKLVEINGNSTLRDAHWYLHNSSSRLRESRQLLKNCIAFRVNLMSQ